MHPYSKAQRLSSPLGGPHVLFDGSFVLEFLQPLPELDASVLMRATYVGGHESLKLGKQHPQAPPLHIHFAQWESFIIEKGAIGTTSTWDTIDTIHTTNANHVQGCISPSSLPARDDEGATNISPWVPHQFWPLAPDHSFWTTTEGVAYEASLPNARTLTSSFPPDMDAAFFLAILALTDAMMSKRVPMTPAVAANMFALQTASDSALLIAPNARWLGPLRWIVPWYAQQAMEVVRKVLGGRDVVKLVEDIIMSEVVKRQ
ncbi:uncharacterized protein BDV14DRAFT_198811 [Aspergillus stella-maris]|uniref:uncharacterized protein n=1 Tax=Aspergillus stella-maris TaxID=1810926 RepID=UPI003CCE1B1B